MVKVRGGLSCPILVGRGIRKGCPISGQLYSIAIEPLLSRLRNKLVGISLLNTPCNVPVAEYTDDVNVFV